MTQTRRAILSGLTSSTAMALARSPGIAAGRAKIVIIGGGVGGAAAAKYLAAEAPSLDITLVERSKIYACCFNSNLYLGGFATFDSLLGTYDALRAKYGIKVIFENALSIDRDRRRVLLESGLALDYDRLIVSPGVELNYQSIPGWGAQYEKIMPHGWQGADQIQLLKAKLDAVEDGGLIVMLAPPNPYCCPPGPYERVSMMSYLLKASGKRKCKIIILDPKKKFAMQGLFEDGWEGLYPGMVEWLDQSIYESIDSVVPAEGIITTGFETFKNIALANIIPSQSAGAIAHAAGLTNESGYCPIDPDSMRSSYDVNVCIVGDACDGGDMPKSAFGANCQGQIAAASLCEELFGKSRPSIDLLSVCWSAISANDAVKVTGQYGPRQRRISSLEGTVSQIGESSLVRQNNWLEKGKWYEKIKKEMFE